MELGYCLVILSLKIMRLLPRQGEQKIRRKIKLLSTGCGGVRQEVSAKKGGVLRCFAVFVFMMKKPTTIWMIC